MVENKTCSQDFIFQSEVLKTTVQNAKPCEGACDPILTQSGRDAGLSIHRHGYAYISPSELPGFPYKLTDRKQHFTRWAAQKRT